METAKPIERYNEFRATIATIEETNKSLVFDYASSKGNKDARSHIYKIRQTRAALEKARKLEKQESLAYGKKVDAEAKEIATKLDKMIAVHQIPLDEIEKKEKQRILDIKGRIERIQSLGIVRNDLGELFPSVLINKHVTKVREFVIDDFYGEFRNEALKVHGETLANLNDLYFIAIEKEAEVAELAKLKKEAAEREQKDREEKIRKEAEQKAKFESKQKAIREKEAAEKRELQLKLDKEKAENDRLEAIKKAQEERELAELARIKAEEDAKVLALKNKEEAEAREVAAKQAIVEAEMKAKREAAAEAKRVEAVKLEIQAKKEADKKHVDAILCEVVDSFRSIGFSSEDTIKIVNALRDNDIKNVTINY